MTAPRVCLPEPCLPFAALWLHALPGVRHRLLVPVRRFLRMRSRGRALMFGEAQRTVSAQRARDARENQPRPGVRVERANGACVTKPSITRSCQR